MSDIRLFPHTHTVVLTGAGVSAASGVPTFRGEDGMWREYQATDLATPEAFERDPKLVWEFYQWRRNLVAECLPNKAHRTLVAMETALTNFTLITQNVDGLHQQAGSKTLLSLHGELYGFHCTNCSYKNYDRAPFETLPPRCPRCDNLLRPNVVWFGELLNHEVLSKAWVMAQQAEVFLIVGTSGMVNPAAQLPILAKASRATVIEFNVEETALTPHVDELVTGPADETLPAWWQKHKP